jgi:peptidyl-prolyl cis-trans isomerase A (cyclophilin A)
MTGLKNVVGTVAMARTSDPNSATAQFFVNVHDNSFLNPTGPGNGYAVFGAVVAGMDTVEKIVAVQTTSRDGMQNVPVVPVVINGAFRVAEK